MRIPARLVAPLAVLFLACEPPQTDQTLDRTAPADTVPAISQRVSAPDAFHGCYFQGQRFSIGAVMIQDGVRKKCVEKGVWHNVDGFGNLTPEDPAVEDTLSVPDTAATVPPTG